MPELLFELGCEELPASFVRRAYEQLHQQIADRLTALEVPFGQSACLGTPRRLIVHFDGVANQQPDQVKEVRGPAIKASFDAEGNPTKALEGFCRGQGVEVTSVRREGDYVYVSKVTAGRPVGELLAEVLPAAVRALMFDKSMRWGQSRMRFARPIRWILAVFDGVGVPFEIEGVPSGQESRGHRFNRPESFAALSFGSLCTELRSRQVEPDPEVRRQRILEQAVAVADGSPDLHPDLVDENVFLTEWPTAIQSQFHEEFLALPEEVLVTAMAKHQRFFPIRDDQGRVTNRFVSIRNGGEEDVVRGGNAWVINARFNDARFFFDEDGRFTLDDFLARTGKMTFQEKLGTVRRRADRLAALTRDVAEVLDANGSDNAEQASLAGLYAKADLSTGLVSELASLQGIVGGIYARRSGLPESVAAALACQYDLDRAAAAYRNGNSLGLAVLAADQLDKLAGYLGVGLIPSGTSDPFGLRRALTLLIQVDALAGGEGLDISVLLERATQLYRDQEVSVEHVHGPAHDLLRSRYQNLMSGVRPDWLEAILTEPQPNHLWVPRRVQARRLLVEALAPDVPFVFTATRPINIVDAARRKAEAFPERAAWVLDSAEGEGLREALDEARGLVGWAWGEPVADHIGRLKSLEAPINRFFDSTMVMVDDPVVRGSRLSLLAEVSDFLLNACDWTKIVIEGQRD